MKILDRFRKRLKLYFDQIASQNVKVTVLQALPFWIASLLVGLVAVGYTKIFSLFEDILSDILQWHSWMIFIMSPLCFILAWIIVKVFAPNAKGSGIPQVMAAIDLATPKSEHKVKKLLSMRILLTKIASSIMMVLGGGAIGREGPTIQISASIFSMVNAIVPARWPKLSRQRFILTGAAAGLAAAFNTPLGGIIFAMEELARVHIRFFRTALFSAVIIAGLTAQAMLGPYLYLGYPNVKGLEFSIFLGVGVTAIVAGILGSLMCKAILLVMKWKKSFSNLQSAAFIIAAGLLVALLAYTVNPTILGSGKDLMNGVLFTDVKSTSWHTALFRFLGPVIAFNVGAAGGIFAPALAAGASVGSFIATVIDTTGANANILILSGMVAFLTGVTRTPFTSAILVLEMTDRHSVIFHLMIAALISNISALIVDKHSFYEQLKKSYIADLESEENPANTIAIANPSLPDKGERQA